MVTLTLKVEVEVLYRGMPVCGIGDCICFARRRSCVVVAL